MKTIYISGAISGLDMEKVKQKFNVAQDALQKLNYHVINPLKLTPASQQWSDYMLEDIKHLFTAHKIYMLKCWKDSRGARIEHKIAEELGLEIIYES